MSPTDLAYRKSATQGVSGFGLLIALYDTLAGDLRRAAAAQRAGNIEVRVRELKHALVVLGVLQNWTESENGDLASKLVALYSQLRRGIMQAQAGQSAEMLEKLMTSVLNIRKVWQNLDLRAESEGPEILPPARNTNYGSFAPAVMERRQLSWSA
jgi:flagellar biosynthetic protein FliS